MADNKAIYRTKLHQIYDIPARDELVQGPVTRDYIRVITGDVVLQRGMLLMSSGEEFVPATKDGLTTAKEICIATTADANGVLDSDEEGAEGVHFIWAYFSGDFKAASVVLAYETEDDVHDELMDEIRPILRQHKFFLK